MGRDLLLGVSGVGVGEARNIFRNVSACSSKANTCSQTSTT